MVSFADSWNRDEMDEIANLCVIGFFHLLLSWLCVLWRWWSGQLRAKEFFFPSCFSLLLCYEVIPYEDDNTTGYEREHETNETKQKIYIYIYIIDAYLHP
jgi:hypothetical protein